MPARALLAGVTLPIDKYPEGEARERFLAGFLERMRALPRVSAAGLTMAMPMVTGLSGLSSVRVAVTVASVGP